MEKICRNCGSAVSAHDRFCVECGAMLEQERNSVIMAEEVEVIIEPPRKYDSPAADFYELRERLVGTKVEYYLPRFADLESQNKFVGWNWAAFIFGICWMMYRKMYVFGLACWLVSAVLSAMGASALSLLFSIAIGAVGNYLYMKDIDNRANKAMDMQPEQRDAFVEKNSGTSWAAVLVLCLLSGVLNSILY